MGNGTCLWLERFLPAVDLVPGTAISVELEKKHENYCFY